MPRQASAVVRESRHQQHFAGFAAHQLERFGEGAEGKPVGDKAVEVYLAGDHKSCQSVPGLPDPATPSCLAGLPLG